MAAFISSRRSTEFWSFLCWSFSMNWIFLNRSRSTWSTKWFLPVCSLQWSTMGNCYGAWRTIRSTCWTRIKVRASSRMYGKRHLLLAGIFIDIPPRTAFKSARLISNNAHYPGYCIAYLGFGYITLGNVLFFVIVILRVIFKHLFLMEEIAKVLIPILVIYLSKLILMWFLSRTFFLQR